MDEMNTVAPERRNYNRWVADETMEDFALRFTARRARRWSFFRVANTAIGSISFLALEAIGAAITLTYGFDIAITAIMVVGAILFLTGLPISYYAARYGVDIDLLTRGAGFGYIGSTITSLVYATFTFIFFALEAAILAFAMEFCFGIPLFLGYLISAILVIPIVVKGFTKISSFHAWTQPLWIILHILPFILLAFYGYDFDTWTSFQGNVSEIERHERLLLFGAASGILFSLIAQIGEQVDFLRFLPEPQNKSDKRKWWISVIAAGPGWSILGVIKLIAGSYLVTLAISRSVPTAELTDPTRMYFVAFQTVISWDVLALFLTGVFVVLSQIKINITNAYAGSIAWSNFFSRLTHAHPGRVVWLAFNVAIALLLMELGVFGALEHILGLYSHVALAWIGAIVADLIVNKPLGLSPKGIEFRRAYLYDINPVGIGAMLLACLASLLSIIGIFGAVVSALSPFVALLVAFACAPLIAMLTRGRYYIARPVQTRSVAGTCTCHVCEYKFDAEDMAHCPFHAGQICSLCCTLEGSCRDQCKPHARIDSMVVSAINNNFSSRIAKVLLSRQARFLGTTMILALFFGSILLIIRSHSNQDTFDTTLTVIFSLMLIVIGIGVWVSILGKESREKARQDVETQTEKLKREIRAHERTDQELQVAKDKAEAANTAKTRYMTGLSHELRTPLNAIYGFAQILEKDQTLPAHRRHSVSTIRRSSEHLAGLIEGLLDISRIEAGRLEIAQDRINLAMFVEQIGSIFEKKASEQNITFKIITSGNIPKWVIADEKRLRQIIINLLSNAFRHTKNGRIELRLRYRNEVAVIEVEDTGEGIHEEDLEKIWRPFERGQSAKEGGTGLGLTITKLLAETQGGEIGVKSVRGKGSNFTVRMMLPTVSNFKYDSQISQSHQPSLPLSESLGKRKKIIVVDDDPNHLTIVENLLAPAGFMVLKASDAQIAKELLQNIEPDLFILDIAMPNQDGWSLATELRGGLCPNVPIIMISGHAEDEEKKSSELPLCDAFIAKPYNLDDLLNRIVELLRLQPTEEPDRVVQKTGSLTSLGDSQEFEDLQRLVKLGHARGIVEKISEIEALESCPPETIKKIRALAQIYDYAALSKYLEHQINVLV